MPSPLQLQLQLHCFSKCSHPKVYHARFYVITTMPLPDEALDVQGGCNCGAVRYRLSIPPVSDRPLHPKAAAESPVPLPFLVVDYCNDCRRATGALLPVWLCAPMKMASVSLVSANPAKLKQKASERKDQPEVQGSPWMPASDIFTPASVNQDHFLRWYESSNERWRWFCSRCGTNIAYTAVYPAGFPNMLDITLGSVDRRYLETEALVPERHLWD